MENEGNGCAVTGGCWQGGDWQLLEAGVLWGWVGKHKYHSLIWCSVATGDESWGGCQLLMALSGQLT